MSKPSYCTGFEAHSGTFVLKFANGYVVSVVFASPLHYCSHRKLLKGNFKSNMISKKFSRCKNAEVAIINPQGEMVLAKDGNQVHGWITPDDLINLIQTYVLPHGLQECTTNSDENVEEDSSSEVEEHSTDNESSSSEEELDDEESDEEEQSPSCTIQ